LCAAATLASTGTTARAGVASAPPAPPAPEACISETAAPWAGVFQALVRYSASAKRTMTRCLFCATHPLLALVPVDPLLEQAEDSLEESCDRECPPIEIHVGEENTGSLLLGVGVNSDAGLTGSVQVHCEVKERPPTRIGQIIIVGNDRTRQN